MHHFSRLLLPIVFVALAAAPAASATAAAAAKAPAGDAFYQPPAKLPGKAHGDLIWFRKIAADREMRLAGAARNLLVLYRSTGLDGRPVAESGAVAIPKGKAPRGGWPVISWAHGTTGLADPCAPTRMSRQTSAYAQDVRSQLASYVRAGYAVVSADYEGLGTPGVHPYLIGQSEGRSVLDIVRAARKIEPRIGKSLAIVGHSQGGHAALWAASLAPRYSSELKLRATVAYAPASHVSEQFNLLDILTQPSPISALIASIFRGADLAYPELQIPTLFEPRAAELFPEVDVKCLDAMYSTTSWGGVAPADILREGVDRNRLLAAADRNDPENLTIRTPLQILQGVDDGTVLPLFTDQLANKLRTKGTKVTYKKHKADHGTILEAGRKDARAFIRKRVGR